MNSVATSPWTGVLAQPPVLCITPKDRRIEQVDLSPTPTSSGTTRVPQRRAKSWGSATSWKCAGVSTSRRSLIAFSFRPSTLRVLSISVTPIATSSKQLDVQISRNRRAKPMGTEPK